MVKEKKRLPRCRWEWLRKGKRLFRRVPDIVCDEPFFELTNVKPLYENNTEILCYNQVRDELIIQNDVTAKHATFESKLHQTSLLVSLPEEIVMAIFYFLPKSDIITMASTCRSIAEFVNRNFVPNVILPLSAQNLRKLDRRYVLSLKSIFNIMTLEKYRKGEYLKNLEKICLKRLQRLVFVLYDYYGDENFPLPYHEVPFHDHILPPPYKDILSYCLSQAKQLTYLHISIDRSKETFKMIDVIAECLPCLKGVVLLATNTPYNVFSPTECEVTQKMREDDREFSTSSYNLNELLTRLLKSTSIISLELLGLTFCQIWGEYTVLDLRENKYSLTISSNSLHHLRIEQDDLFEIIDIECPELLTFKHFDFGADIVEFNCLKHSGIFKNSYETLLISCPKITRINQIDINSLRRKLDADKQCMDKLLDEVCPCINIIEQII